MSSNGQSQQPLSHKLLSSSNNNNNDNNNLDEHHHFHNYHGYTSDHNCSTSNNKWPSDYYNNSDLFFGHIFHIQKQLDWFLEQVEGNLRQLEKIIGHQEKIQKKKLQEQINRLKRAFIFLENSLSRKQNEKTIQSNSD
jgi:hypothetical protein